MKNSLLGITKNKTILHISSEPGSGFWISVNSKVRFASQQKWLTDCSCGGESPQTTIVNWQTLPEVVWHCQKTMSTKLCTQPTPFSRVSDNTWLSMKQGKLDPGITGQAADHERNPEDHQPGRLRQTGDEGLFSFARQNHDAQTRGY